MSKLNQEASANDSEINNISGQNPNKIKVRGNHNADKLCQFTSSVEQNANTTTTSNQLNSIEEVYKYINSHINPQDNISRERARQIYYQYHHLPPLKMAKTINQFINNVKELHLRGFYLKNFVTKLNTIKINKFNKVLRRFVRQLMSLIN